MNTHTYVIDFSTGDLPSIREVSNTLKQNHKKAKKHL